VSFFQIIISIHMLVSLSCPISMQPHRLCRPLVFWIKFTYWIQFHKDIKILKPNLFYICLKEKMILNAYVECIHKLNDITIQLQCQIIFFFLIYFHLQSKPSRISLLRSYLDREHFLSLCIQCDTTMTLTR
jgi:hypothetical protein